MPIRKKLRLCQQVAIIMSILWTITTYIFIIYQIDNEQTHILNSTITRAKIATTEAKELILWRYSEQSTLQKNNPKIKLNGNFSLRNLIFDLAKREGSTLKIETNYLEDDFDSINSSVKTVIKNVQKYKKDEFIHYKVEDKDYLFYMKPLLADASCVKCHVHEDDKVGDVMGSVNINMKVPTFKEYNSHSYYFLIFMYLITWIVGLVIIWWIRYKSRQYFDEKAQHYEESIYSLVDIMERRDSYTAGHSKRVAQYSLLIAQELKFDEDDLALIFRAGMLHDIGKIEVPDALLLKPGKLTDSEYDLIKTHSSVGYELLSREPFSNLASIILYHHERYDGTGYPYGLKGNDIPYLSQIISLADVYDAVTTSRAYRSAMSQEEALNIIENGRGTLFNPDLVDTAKKVFQTINHDKQPKDLPPQMVDNIRFSYYFKDELTGFFNSNYLKFLFTHKDNYTILSVCYLNCINFTGYNKKHGWEKGDDLLKEIANFISSKYKDSILVRVFGDNFIILYLDKDIAVDISVFDELSKNYDIKLHLKHINIFEKEIDSFEKLENTIIQEND